MDSPPPSRPDDGEGIIRRKLGVGRLGQRAWQRANGPKLNNTNDNLSINSDDNTVEAVLVVKAEAVAGSRQKQQRRKSAPADVSPTIAKQPGRSSSRSSSPVEPEVVAIVAVARGTSAVAVNKKASRISRRRGRLVVATVAAVVVVVADVRGTSAVAVNNNQNTSTGTNTNT